MPIKALPLFIVIFACAVTLAAPLKAHSLTAPFPCPQGLVCPGSNSSLGINSVNNLIITVINWLLGIVFGITVLFLMIGGFRYIVAGGNEESAEKAKGTIINAIIGIVIVLLSYAIINVIVNTISRNSAQAP